MTEAAFNLKEASAAQTDTGARIRLAGHVMRLIPEGALYWPEQDALIVADLHLEKGTSRARRGVFLPPYDTAATLAALAALCARHNPACVIALGDSFHDSEAPDRIDGAAAAAIASLQHNRDWIWIAGNHDPHPPSGLGGMAAREVSIGGVIFRHEPDPAAETGEVAGHLHPAGKVRVRGRSIRRRCFLADEKRMILPAFGAYTGGLNVLDRAFAGLFTGPFHAWMMGEGSVYPVQKRRLLRDG